MIHNVVDFRGVKVRDVMLPLAKVVALRPSASTHRSPGRAPKARKLSPDSTNPHMDEDAEDVSASLYRTPSPHSSVGEESNIINPTKPVRIPHLSKNVAECVGYSNGK